VDVSANEAHDTGETAAQTAEPQADAASNDEAAREAVRLAVERAKAEMSGGSFGSAAGPEEAEDPREAVRRMVEQTRTELFFGAPSGASERTRNEAESAEVDPRQAVRRAVEASRAELGLGQPEDEAPPHGESSPRPMQMPDAVRTDSGRFAGLEALGAPSLIVIEDPEGRVELVQVYATLDRISKASQAALLNYTPHSVTVGLNSFAQPPSTDELAAAAEAVFGRSCKVANDGTRLSVLVGGKAA
jgi:hypothetical protein